MPLWCSTRRNARGFEALFKEGAKGARDRSSAASLKGARAPTALRRSARRPIEQERMERRKSEEHRSTTVTNSYTTARAHFDPVDIRVSCFGGFRRRAHFPRWFNHERQVSIHHGVLAPGRAFLRRPRRRQTRRRRRRNGWKLGLERPSRNFRRERVRRNAADLFCRRAARLRVRQRFRHEHLSPRWQRFRAVRMSADRRRGRRLRNRRNGWKWGGRRRDRSRREWSLGRCLRVPRSPESEPGPGRLTAERIGLLRRNRRLRAAHAASAADVFARQGRVQSGSAVQSKATGWAVVRFSQVPLGTRQLRLRRTLHAALLRSRRPFTRGSGCGGLPG